MENKSNGQKLISTIIIGCLALAVLAAGGYAFWVHYSGSATPTPAPTPVPTPVPKPTSKGTMTATPQSHIKHFDLFVKLFEKKMDILGIYVFNKAYNGLTENDKAILVDYFDDLRLTVLIENYNRLFGVSEKSSAMRNSQYSYVQDIQISDFQNMNEEDAKSTIGKILDDGNVMIELIITALDCRNTSSINLSNFTINHIPEGLKFFPNLKIIDVARTGITSLDGLDDLARLEVILAMGNKITEVPVLENSPGIGTLDIGKNNITKIDPKFLSIHGSATIWLEYEKSTDLPEDIKKLAKNSNGRIVFSP